MAEKRNLRQRRFERLEPRVVLDGAAGAGQDWLGSNLDGGGAASDLGRGEGEGAAVAELFSAEKLEEFLVQDALKRYRHLFGQPAWPSRWWGPYAWETVDLAVANVSAAADAASHAETNVQVAGVDEGDLVKTDGRYLYIGRPDGLTIIDVQTADSPKVVARTEIEGRPSSLYLAGDRLVVISQDDSPEILPMDALVADIWPGPWQQDDAFHVTVFDVSAPQDASVIRRFEIEGYFVDSRMLGETVYLVSSSDFYLPPPEYHCDETDPELGGDSGNQITDVAFWTSSDMLILPPIGPDPGGTSCVYETQAEYQARIEGWVLELALPDYSTYNGQGVEVETGLLVGGDAIYLPPGREHDQLLSITALDLSAAPVLADTTGVPSGWTSEMYMSHENLYVVVPTVLEGDRLRSGIQILQFALQGSNGGIELAAQGQVAGWLQDSFALDEYDGHLRVVTQEGWGLSSSSHLYVLDAIEGNLVTVGELAGLAEGERLHSVRFLQDQAFLVTFGPTEGNWIDPLWAIDVSDPASPQVVGELEIPGFSDYLQRIEGDYLLGLGRDADIGTGRWLAPQISLYDVTDFHNPQLADRRSFAESAQVWSDAFWDHHAISYYPEYGVLAIPMTSVESTPAEPDNWRPWLWQERNELWVFQIDVTAGDEAIGLLGRIEHDSVVRRSLRIGEMLYSVSEHEVQVHPILDPSTQLATVPLGPLVLNDFFRVDSDRVDEPLDVLANDLLGRDETARITSVGEIQHGGTVTIAADGRSLLYTPADGFFGVETFTYVASGVEGEGTATVHVDVTLTVDEDSTDNLLKPLSGLELDIDTPARIVAAEPLHPEAVLQITSDEQGLLYSPAPDFTGPDWLILTIEFGEPVQTLQRHVDVFVRDVNDPPVAADDVFVLRAQSPQHILRVLANDTTLPDGGEQLEIVAVGPTSGGGEVQIDERGQRLLYRPPTDDTRFDSFTYTVSDGRGGLDEATVTIELREWNDGDVMATIAAEDLAERLQLPLPEILVLSIEETDWPDACLGIAADSAACADVIVPGYRILLVHGSQVHAYHTDRDQTVRYAGVDAEDAPLVRIWLEAVDAEGNGIDSVQSGESFTLNIYAEDLRHNSQGVYAAYVDVLYRNRLLRVDGDVSFAADYPNGQKAESDTPGLIDEVGAFAGLTPLGGGEHRIASVTLVADRAGLARLALAAADEIGSEVLLYGSNDPVPIHRVLLEGTELNVLPGWHNVDRPSDVNEDGLTTPEDVLAVINDMNLVGIRRLARAAETAGETAQAVHYFLDVNRDDYLTPLDALIIINELNDRSLHAVDASVAAEDNFADSGWARFADDTIVSWVDWPALADELSQPNWQTALDALELSAADAAELAYGLLVAGDVRLSDLQQAASWWSEAEAETVRQTWQEFRSQHGGPISVDQASVAFQHLGPLLEQLDLEPLLPGLAAKLGGQSPEIVIRDAILAQFEEPGSWLMLLGL